MQLRTKGASFVVGDLFLDLRKPYLKLTVSRWHVHNEFPNVLLEGLFDGAPG